LPCPDRFHAASIQIAIFSFHMRAIACVY
jgi:hypothetical protein